MMPKVPQKPKSKKPKAHKVIYPEYAVSICRGAEALTVSKAKELLGWLEEGEEPFGGDHLYVASSLCGKKVRATNNIKNRPLYRGNILKLKQEILQGRWRFNSDSPIIIGRTGLVINGQHTMVALILASQTWKTSRNHYPQWPQEPTIDKLVTLGLEETDAVINTIDMCKTRSLLDVIYRSEYFDDLLPRERVEVARIADYAVKVCWDRTGAKEDPYAPLRTHAEMLDFLARHNRLLEAVRFVHSENGSERRIAKTLVGPGYAAGFLYLMGSAATEHDAYYGSSPPSEDTLDWSLWDKACDFWVRLASGSIPAVGQAINQLLIDSGGSVPERLAIIALAWRQVVEDKPVEAEDLVLKFTTEDDIVRLSHHPSVGGIDLGLPDSDIPDTPEPEEIAERAGQQRRKRATKGSPKIGHRGGNTWAKGDTAWVLEPDGESYFGSLNCDPYACDDGEVNVLIQVGADEFVEQIGFLSLEKPAA